MTEPPLDASQSQGAVVGGGHGSVHQTFHNYASGDATTGADTAWRVPPGNPVFTGRAEVLASLAASFRRDGGRAVIHALHGAGGIGKTALAIQYAHRHTEDYDIVWWVPSEDPAMIPAALAELAQTLGLAARGDAVAVAVARLQTHLRERGRWLICFDNAEDPATLREHLCAGPGHVLITSRARGWEGIAERIDLDVLDPDDAAALLRAHARHLGDDDARAVAEALGHLPLALAQAGAFLADGPLSVADYLTELDQRAAAVLARGRLADYPVSLAATWELGIERLATDDLAALQMLTLSAYLAPEPIPFTLFTDQTALLPEPLATVAGDRLDFADAVAALRNRALARTDREAGTLQVHRLAQALLRAHHETHPELYAPAPP